MLKKLLFLPDIMERYGIRDHKTGRRIMREMGAQGKGKSFFVTEDLVEAWDRKMTTPPEPRQKKARVKVPDVDGMIIPKRA